MLNALGTNAAELTRRSRRHGEYADGNSEESRQEHFEDDGGGRRRGSNDCSGGLPCEKWSL